MITTKKNLRVDLTRLREKQEGKQVPGACRSKV
jgi:hypothetical protein